MKVNNHLIRCREVIANYKGVMIGIDPGTKIIGVAIVKDRNPIFCGRIKSNGKTVIERLGDIGNQVLRQNFFGLANLKNDGTFQFFGIENQHISRYSSVIQVAQSMGYLMRIMYPAIAIEVQPQWSHKALCGRVMQVPDSEMVDMALSLCTNAVILDTIDSNAAHALGIAMAAHDIIINLQENKLDESIRKN